MSSALQLESGAVPAGGRERVAPGGTSGSSLAAGPKWQVALPHRPPFRHTLATAGADGLAAAREQCRALQRRLDETLRERDALVLDLEAMCLSSDGGATTFNSSSVLQERIFSTGGCTAGRGHESAPKLGAAEADRRSRSCS